MFVALILVAVVGACLVVAGVALMAVPAALIVAGVILMAGAYLIAEEVR